MKNMLLRTAFTSASFKAGVHQYTYSCLQCRCQYLRHLRQVRGAVFLVPAASLQDTAVMIKNDSSQNWDTAAILHTVLVVLVIVIPWCCLLLQKLLPCACALCLLYLSLILLHPAYVFPLQFWQLLSARDHVAHPFCYVLQMYLTFKVNRPDSRNPRRGNPAVLSMQG